MREEPTAQVGTAKRQKRTFYAMSMHRPGKYSFSFAWLSQADHRMKLRIMVSFSKKRMSIELALPGLGS